MLSKYIVMTFGRPRFIRSITWAEMRMSLFHINIRVA
jgi:hypothetical protein